MKRAFLLLTLLLLSASQVWAAPALSARVIGGVELGFVESEAFTVSRDGRYLAVLSAPGEKGSDCTLIERATHKFWDVPGSSRMEPLTFSRDGRALWVWGLHADDPLPGAPNVARGAAFIALYDLRKRRYRFALTGDVEDWGVPSQSALSRDGHTLIFASADGWVRGFSTRDGRQKWKRRAIDNGDVPVNAALSADGSRYLRFPDNAGHFQTTQIVSTRNGRVLRTLKLPLRGGLMSAFQGGRFAPRGNMVAVFKPDDQSWNFFDGRSGRPKWKMGQPSTSSEGDLTWVWSPDAKWVAVSGPRGFELRDARSGRITSATSADEFAGYALVFAPDSSRVYALAGSDTGFGAETVLWQLRVGGTRAQRRADAFWLGKARAAEAKFALSPRHINQSLTMAARAGDDGRVAFLLDRGAPIETLDRDGATPLANAVFANDVYAGPHRYKQTVQLLLKRGASVKAQGGTLLASAAAKGNDALIRVLLGRGVQADTDAAGYGTATALVAAIGFGRVSSARLLLDAGANVNAREEDGSTPLIEAMKTSFADGNEVAMVQLLLERGADPNLTNSVGQTALMRLVQWDAGARIVSQSQMLNDQKKIIGALLKHGADPKIRDPQGRDAAALATSPALKKALGV